jgi:hypothetical protein
LPHLAYNLKVHRMLRHSLSLNSGSGAGHLEEIGGRLA